MPTYFKAVQLDGTDFRTGTVNYAGIMGTGESLPELPGGECCGPGVYHASTVAAETLIGGRWPCRLFEVEGQEVAEDGYKRGFKTLRVVRELEAHRALGPNGREVAALIERAGRLTDTEVQALEAARGAAWEAAREAAREAAWSAARGAAREAAWSAASDAASDAARRAAWDAASDAVLALMVKDLISDEQFAALMKPWKIIEGSDA